jgi:hypothetical protein
VLVADGALVTGNFDTIVADGQKQAARLWKRMAEI